MRLAMLSSAGTWYDSAYRCFAATRVNPADDVESDIFAALHCAGMLLHEMLQRFLLAECRRS